MTIRHPNTALNTAVSRQVGLMLKLSTEASSTESSKAGGIIVESSQTYANAPSLSLLTNNTRRLTIDNSGNVGIGTTAPASFFNVSAAPTASANFGLVSLGSGPFNGSTAGYFVGNSNGTVLAANTATGYTGDLLNLEIAGVSKYKVDASGNITSTGTTTSSGNTTSTGNYSTSGNISTTGTGTITSAGAIIDSSTTASTSSTTGALIVSGGEGIAGALNVGSTLNSTGSITSGGVYKAAYGTAAAPSYTYTSDATTGNFSPSAGIWAVSTSGVEKMRVQANGNVGIGTTAPGYQLDIQNSQNASTNVRLENASSGTSATANFLVQSDIGAGYFGIASQNVSGITQNRAYLTENTLGGIAIYTQNTAAILFGIGGSEQMRVDSTGYVGIGTTSPGANLDVESTGQTSVNIGSSGTNQSAFLNLNATGSASGVVTSTTALQFRSGGLGEEARFHTTGNFILENGSFSSDTGNKLQVNGTSYFNGNVGIGTTSPSVPLEVGGNGQALFDVTGSGGHIGVGAPNGESGFNIANTNRADIRFDNNTLKLLAVVGTGPAPSTNGIAINTSGYVGIGTTSPGALLNVYSSAAASSTGQEALRLGGQTPGATAGAGPYIRFDNGANLETGRVAAVSEAVSQVGMAFYTYNSTSTEKMRVSATGNVGIGTTAPSTALQVAGEISPSTDNAYQLGDSTHRFTAVYAVNGTIQTSDVREKKNIQGSDLGLEFINQLRPVSYYWKSGPDKILHYGLIAQETEKAVSGAHKQLAEQTIPIVDHDAKSDKYGIRYTELLSPLIKAVQELAEKLAILVNKVTTLEGKDAAQDRMIASVKAENTQLKQENAKKTQDMEELKARMDRLEKMLSAK